MQFGSSQERPINQSGFFPRTNMGYNAMVVQPDFPTPQTVWMRSDVPRIQLALTGLDQYYSNVQYNSNQHYCYYQISYVDVPQVDDIIKILRNDKLVITVDVSVLYEQQPDSFGEYVDSPMELNSEGSFDIVLQLESDMNAESLAMKVRQALYLASQTLSATWPVYGRTPTAPNEQEQYAISAFFTHFSDYNFDPISQKYVVIYKPPEMLRWNFFSPGRFLAVWLPPSAIMPEYLVVAPSMRMSIDPTKNNLASWSKKQLTMLSNMFGAHLPSNGIPVVDFSAQIQPLQRDYQELVRNLVNLSRITTPVDITQVDTSDVLDTIDKNYMHKLFNSLTTYSQKVPKFNTDNYVYVSSSAATNMWSIDGRTMSTVAVLPRNKPFSNVAAISDSNLSNSTMIKAPINAVKQMQILFTDRDGQPLEVIGEYVLALTIHFNLALPKE